MHSCVERGLFQLEVDGFLGVKSPLLSAQNVNIAVFKGVLQTPFPPSLIQLQATEQHIWENHDLDDDESSQVISSELIY